MEKYQDFLKVYEHVIMTREPGFAFEEEEALQNDWNSMSKKEIEQDISESFLFDKQSKEERRYLALISDYDQRYLASYLGRDIDRAAALSFTILRIFNYLEFSTEVEMNNLQIIRDKTGFGGVFCLGLSIWRNGTVFNGNERFDSNRTL